MLKLLRKYTDGGRIQYSVNVNTAQKCFWGFIKKGEQSDRKQLRQKNEGWGQNVERDFI